MTLSSLLPPAEDACWIKSRLEIRQIIRDLARKGASLRCWTGLSEPLHATVLEVLDSDEMVLRADPDGAMNRAIQANESVLVAANLERVSVRFLISGLQRMAAPRASAVRAALPERLHKLQRRECYRVASHSSMACELSVPYPLGQIGPAAPRRLVLRVIDVSLGGLCLVVPPDCDFPVQIGQVVSACSIDLPGFGPMAFDLQFIHVLDAGAASGEQLIGARFVGLDARGRGLLQRYLYQRQTDFRF